MAITVAELAASIEGVVVGDGSVGLTGVAPAATAEKGDLTFAENESHLAIAEASEASAILVPEGALSSSKVLIHVANPRVALAKALPSFCCGEPREAGVHPTAIVAASASVDETAYVGPSCVIDEGVEIGARCVLHGANFIKRDSKLGEDVELHPRVVLYPKTVVGDRVVIHAGTVIGSDGFGYVFDGAQQMKMPHIGHVIIGDDVEIGANTAIDRGMLGPTRIGRGSKFDNLVHVAHNVEFGEHCLIMGQCGFAGSSRLGDYSVVASQAGIAGHLQIGPRSTIGAKTGVMRDVPEGITVLGIPAAPDKQTKRQWIAMQQLPDLLRQVRAQQKQIDALRAELDSRP